MTKKELDNLKHQAMMCDLMDSNIVLKLIDELDRYKRALRNAGECGHGMLQTTILNLEDEIYRLKKGK